MSVNQPHGRCRRVTGSPCRVVPSLELPTDWRTPHHHHPLGPTSAQQSDTVRDHCNKDTGESVGVNSVHWDISSVQLGRTRVQ